MNMLYPHANLQNSYHIRLRIYNNIIVALHQFYFFCSNLRFRYGIGDLSFAVCTTMV